MIKVQDLTVSLGGTTILDDISLEIPHGHWTCLVGPNGAGKTTLLKTLLGVREYSGSLQDKGVEVSAITSVMLLSFLSTQKFQRE